MSFDPDEFDPPLTHFWEAETLPGERPVAFALSSRNLYLPRVDSQGRHTLVEVPLRSVRGAAFTERRPLPGLLLLGAVSAVILWFSFGLPPPGGSFDQLAPSSPLCAVVGLLVPGWVAWRLPRSGRLVIEHGAQSFAWDLPVSTDPRHPDSREIVAELLGALAERSVRGVAP